MRTVEQLAQATNPTLVRAFGAIRRMVVTLTDSAIWQVAGVLMPDGREAMRAEVFGGVGFYARPPAGVEAEAVVAMGGDATNPVIVGVRDEATRKAMAGGLKADESAMYNSSAIVYVKEDGTIEARSKNGTAEPLATKADLEELRAKLISWTPAPTDGGAALKTILTAWLGPGPVYPWPTGTSRLKGE